MLYIILILTFHSFQRVDCEFKPSEQYLTVAMRLKEETIIIIKILYR